MVALPVPVFALLFGREWFAEPGSVLGHRIDAVDHAGDVTQQLQQEGPGHPPGQPLVEEYGQERQEETQDDQENLDHDLTDLPGTLP
jgi:hypothetical protein